MIVLIGLYDQLAVEVQQLYTVLKGVQQAGQDIGTVVDRPEKSNGRFFRFIGAKPPGAEIWLIIELAHGLLYSCLRDRGYPAFFGLAVQYDRYRSGRNLCQAGDIFYGSDDGSHSFP